MDIMAMIMATMAIIMSIIMARMARIMAILAILREY